MLIETAEGIAFEPERCTQCGACLAACKTGSIKALPVANGLFHFSWHGEDCTRCLACIRVCPAHHLPEAGFAPGKLDAALGFFLAAARDRHTRSQASSGGAGRLLVKTALDSGVADLAYTLRNVAAYPWAEGSFWQKGDNIAAMPNSMYLPILAMKNLRLTEQRKKLLVVGTPCQLLAAEALIGKKTERLFKVAIYCKQQKDFRATEYCARRLKIKTQGNAPGQIRELAYRGEGWPGRVMVNRRNLAWEQAAGVPFGKRLWRVPGCRFCPDAFGIDVDLTLLDPWGIRQENPLGETLVAAWTRQGLELLEAAGGELRSEPLAAEEGKRAVNVVDMRHKAALVSYYLGRRVGLRTRLAGLGERFQGWIYEAVLERFSLPTIAHKLIAHAPDLRDLFLGDQHSSNRKRR